MSCWDSGNSVEQTKWRERGPDGDSKAVRPQPGSQKYPNPHQQTTRLSYPNIIRVRYLLNSKHPHGRLKLKDLAIRNLVAEHTCLILFGDWSLMLSNALAAFR
jgi:hypothetical protein